MATERKRDIDPESFANWLEVAVTVLIGLLGGVAFIGLVLTAAKGW